MRMTTTAIEWWVSSPPTALSEADLAWYSQPPSPCSGPERRVLLFVCFWLCDRSAGGHKKPQTSRQRSHPHPGDLCSERESCSAAGSTAVRMSLPSLVRSERFHTLNFFIDRFGAPGTQRHEPRHHNAPGQLYRKRHVERIGTARRRDCLISAPASTAGSSTLTLTADRSTNPTTASFTITGTAGNVSRSIAATASVPPVITGTVPVDLASVYNVAGIYDDGAIPLHAIGEPGWRRLCALSRTIVAQVGSRVGSGVVFCISGPANAPDAVTGKIVTLPQGKFDSLKILAVGVNGDQELQTFTVTYADGTSSPFTHR